VVVQEGNWGSLSLDGKQVAYSGIDNAIHVVQVDTGAEKILQKATGFDIHWSPDGKQLGYIHLGGGIIDSAAIASVDGVEMHQVSDLSYETMIGWSPDGARLYFAVPYTGGAAWKIYAYETVNGSLNELFTIENGTPKFLNPQLSSDGQWIAYRGKNNSSVYLVHPDGSDMHLLVENAGVGGLDWSLSGWLGFSLLNSDSSESRTGVLKPDGCEGYMLPDTLHGELQGLYLP
jgi:Tol biopolymer transport system component